MSDGLPDLVSHVRLDTTGVSTGVAKTKAELGGLGGTTKTLEGDFKSLLSQITSLGPGTSALSGHFSTFAGAAGKAKAGLADVSSEGAGLKPVLAAVGLGVAGVGVAVAGFAVASVGKFIAVAGEVNKLKTTLGSTAEDASKLRNVAIGLGVDVDTMGKALFKLGPILEKNKGDLAGVNVEIAKNADGTTNMVGTIDNMRKAYQALTDPIQKAQFLQEAFKKTGLDLRPIMAATAEQFNKLANTGPIIHQADIDKAKELAIAQRELKQKLDDVQVSLAQKVVPAYEKADHAAYSYFKNLELGILKVASPYLDTSKKQKDIQDQINHAFDTGKGSAQAYNDALTEATSSAEKAAAAFDKLVTAQESSLDKDIAMDHALRTAVQSVDGVTKAQLALAQAHQTVTEKQAALNKVQTDGASTASDISAATLDLEQAQLAEKDAATGVTDAQNAQRDALINAAKAVRDKQVADSEAAGESVNAEAKTRLFIQALRDQASTLAPGSELRTYLDGYADKLENGIPHEVSTTFNTNIQDVGDQLDGLRAKLRALDGTTATVTIFHNNETVYHDDLSHSDAAPSGSASGNILGQRSIIPLARGGRTNGFITSGPSFLVGEGNPRFPEVVVPSDPAVPLQRRLGLLSAAEQMNGVSGGGAGIDYDRMPALDYDRLGAAVAAALATTPVRAVVVASDVAYGLHQSRRR